MIGELTNHLWQSTWFAVAVGLLTLAFRRNRAHVRFWLWFSASLKFFMPFAVLMSLGTQVHWAPARKMATQIAAPSISYTVEQIAQPFSAALPMESSTGGGDWVTIAILAVWASGFAGVMLFRLRSWLRIRIAVRGADTRVCRVETRLDAFRAARQICDEEASSIPVEIRFSPDLLEPGVVGILRPILLLPAGISNQLTQPQLEAVLAHELCHVRRRDNLFAAIHMVAEVVFWFHPLVWWIGARLVEERERACDEEVLRLGSEPLVYAEGILNVCKLYVESPLVCVSGVTGADLKKRIEAIMANRIRLRLNAAKKAALAVAGVAALAAPIIVGMTHAPVIRAQSPATPAAKFEVTSVKPCKDSAPDAGRKGGAPAPGGPSGRLAVPCRSTMDLIRMAYVQFANGKRNFPGRHVQIEGGPSWLNSDRYQIEAKSEGAPGLEMMRGPLLQSILEDRFKLKIRRETREVPVYVLALDKGGPKNLEAAREGGCIPLDLNHPPPPPEPGKPLPLLCGMLRRGRDLVEIRNTTIENLSEQFSVLLGRDVIDKTGIAGLFDIKVEVTPFDVSVGAPDSARFATQDYETGLVFASIRKLGFKLESAKGPGQFLVIDHVERPTEN
jgi:bla regulator protein blaR1